MGIRLFNSKASLQDIFEEFEDIDSEDEDEDPNNNNGTAVMTSQLRHFVVQVSSPPSTMHTYRNPTSYLSGIHYQSFVVRSIRCRPSWVYKYS